MANQYDMFPTEVFLKKIDAENNKCRFYHLSICIDIFGDACLVRRWGRIGTYGHVKTEWHKNPGHAHDALLKIDRTKRKRGYV